MGNMTNFMPQQGGQAMDPSQFQGQGQGGFGGFGQRSRGGQGGTTVQTDISYGAGGGDPSQGQMQG
jgi:hypothetical protein